MAQAAYMTTEQKLEDREVFEGIREEVKRLVERHIQRVEDTDKEYELLGLAQSFEDKLVEWIEETNGALMVREFNAGAREQTAL